MTGGDQPRHELEGLRKLEYSASQSQDHSVASLPKDL